MCLVMVYCRCPQPEVVARLLLTGHLLSIQGALGHLHAYGKVMRLLSFPAAPHSLVAPR